MKDVLGQITRAVNKNDTGDGVEYTVDYTKGVDFDLAVTTINTLTTEKGVSGGIKVHIVGAEGVKNNKSEDTHQQTSRVKFNVNLHNKQSNTGVVRPSRNGFSSGTF